jgi:Ca2+-binding RTX toxin-like protein
MYGGSGNDVLNGGADNDQLHGDDDNDIINGGAGIDMLFGGSGADVLTGGAGADIIDLGNDSAADTIMFDLGDSAAYDHIDQISNFHAGEDKVDLSSFLNMHFASNGFTGSGPEVMFTGENMMIDADGDGRADMVVRFEGGVHLTGSDFLF